MGPAISARVVTRLMVSQTLGRADETRDAWTSSIPTGIAPARSRKQDYSVTAHLLVSNCRAVRYKVIIEYQLVYTLNSLSINQNATIDNACLSDGAVLGRWGMCKRAENRDILPYRCARFGLGFAPIPMSRKKFKKYYAVSSEQSEGGVPSEANIGADTTGEGADLRWRMLDEYASSHPGQPVSGYVRKLFPELANKDRAPGLPDKAPLLWASGRIGSEDPVSFIRRVYAPWLGHGLTRAHIRRFDPQLYSNFHRWVGVHGTPDDFHLPTLKQQNDEILARFEEAAAKGSLQPDGAVPGARELRRMLSLMRNRTGHRVR